MKINPVHFEEIGLKEIEKKRKAVLAVRGMVIKNAIQKMTHDLLFDFQSNYIAISEIRDEKGVRSGNKNWSPRQSQS